MMGNSVPNNSLKAIALYRVIIQKSLLHGPDKSPLEVLGTLTGYRVLRIGERFDACSIKHARGRGARNANIQRLSIRRNVKLQGHLTFNLVIPGVLRIIRRRTLNKIGNPRSLSLPQLLWVLVLRLP